MDGITEGVSQISKRNPREIEIELAQSDAGSHGHPGGAINIGPRIVVANTERRPHILTHRLRPFAAEAELEFIVARLLHIEAQFKTLPHKRGSQAGIHDQRLRIGFSAELNLLSKMAHCQT